MKSPQFPRPSYHLPHFLLTLPNLSICPMHRPHHRKVQYKAEVALFASMRKRQRKLATTPTGLPSSDVLWHSLRLQLMDTLQRFTSERKLTVTEAKEMLLWTPPLDLTMEEWCWLESARNLVSIMPPPTDSEVNHYDLSSYPPKLIPQQEALAAPSTSMRTNITPQTLLALAAADPPPPSLGPHPPTSTSISSRVTLPSVPTLIRAIFQTDPLPTPTSASLSQLTKRCPHSAIRMAPPCTTARPGSTGSSPPPRPTTPHPTTGQTLCLLGSYGTKDLEELTSRSRTSRATPSSPTTSRS